MHKYKCGTGNLTDEIYRHYSDMGCSVFISDDYKFGVNLLLWNPDKQMSENIIKELRSSIENNIFGELNSLITKKDDYKKNNFFDKLYGVRPVEKTIEDVVTKYEAKFYDEKKRVFLYLADNITSAVIDDDLEFLS